MPVSEPEKNADNNSRIRRANHSIDDSETSKNYKPLRTGKDMLKQFFAFGNTAERLRTTKRVLQSGE
jgi:hypothetical protein